MECDLLRYDNEVETTMGIHSWNFLGENSFRAIKKPSEMDHLQINATCVGMLI